MSPFRIRSFEPRDLEAVAALEALCNPAPWSAEALAPYSREYSRERDPASGRTGLVAEAETRVVGYVIASRAADEAEILQFGVAPEHRRQGIAGALLRELFARLEASGTRTVFLEVRRGNAAARALYAASGFVEAGERKGYYADGEDAVLLHRRLFARTVEDGR